MEVKSENIAIIERLTALVGGLQNIHFITKQGLESGSDIDIYCVVKNSQESRVLIEERDGIWSEMFIDSWNDMTEKIVNADEIVRNFIIDMPLLYTEDDSHLRARALIPAQYALPIERRNLLYYRIKVLGSKYLSAVDARTQAFFRGQLYPHLALAIFDRYGLWPRGPKQWLRQLEEMGESESEALLQVLNDNAVIPRELIHMFADKFNGLDIKKAAGKNKITYLG